MYLKMWVFVVIMTVGALGDGGADDAKTTREEIKTLEKQMSTLKIYQHSELMSIYREMEAFRDVIKQFHVTMHRKSKHNVNWARNNIEEMRVEMKKQGEMLKDHMAKENAEELQQQVRSALSQSAELVKQREADRKKLEDNAMLLAEMQMETQELRTSNRDLHDAVHRLEKEVMLTKTTLNETLEKLNEVRQTASPRYIPRTTNSKLRHLRVMRHKITDLIRWRERTEEIQASMQRHIQSSQYKLEQCAKTAEIAVQTNQVSSLDRELKSQRDDILNVTSKISDLDKMHVSMLELLENVQNVENKVDRTLPEFRKEISKLDVNMAQVNSQISYNREDTENLRQSVKAIAYSVSNSMDKADVDRALLHHVNYSVSALEQLSKQHSYRLYDHIIKTEANRTDNESLQYENDAFDPYLVLPELMGEVKDLQPANKEYEELVGHLPKDCSTVEGPAGKYLIAPDDSPIETWCNNGSTLLQRRFDGSVEFNLKFNGYVRTFGTPSGEFWMGLENMHRLTSDNCSTMRIDMTDIYGGRWYASYDSFYVGPAAQGYRLLVSGFTGNASDAFEYQNRMEFSTIDRDRDISNTHCAANYEGGWWFSHCQHVNINGKYTLGLTWFDSSRNEWIAVAASEMTMGRRKSCVPTTAAPSAVDVVVNATLATITTE